MLGKLIYSIFIIFIFQITLSSCKKKYVNDQTPIVIDPNAGVDINGNTWKKIDSSFVANERIMGLATYQDKLVVSFLYFSSDVYCSGHLGYDDKIKPHNLHYLMSGSGFEKAVVVDNELYGLGQLDNYSCFKFNQDYFNGSYFPWDGFWGSNTNQMGIAKFNNTLVGSFGISPFVRTRDGSMTFPDIVGNSEIIHDIINYNGEIIIAGSFQSYNGTTLNNIAKWDGNSWVPLASGLIGTVYDLDILNGDLIVGGDFTKSGDDNMKCRKIAKWDGISWSDLDEGIIGSEVRVLHVYSNQLFVGGDFSSASSVSSPNILKWKNGQWCELASGIGVPLPVGEIAVHDNHLYVANAFNSSQNFLLRLE